MARKEDKQQQYLPLIVKAKLHTGGRDYEKIKEELKGQGFTCKQMKGMVREGNYFDGIWTTLLFYTQTKSIWKR